jgi:hypothetical protein
MKPADTAGGSPDLEIGLAEAGSGSPILELLRNFSGLDNREI